MKFFRRLFLSWPLLFSFAIGTPSSATVLLTTFSGVISEGNDNTGVFGSIGNIRGVHYTVQYVFDTGEGQMFYDGAPSEHDRGGNSMGTVAPLPSVSITINNITLILGSSDYDDIGYYPQQSHLEYIARGAATESGYENGSSFIDLVAFYTPVVDIFTPFSKIETTMLGRVNFQATNSTTGAFEQFSADFGQNNTGTIQIQEAGPVPELATWAMMVVGLGMIGTGMRRAKTSHRNVLSA